VAAMSLEEFEAGTVEGRRPSLLGMMETMDEGRVAAMSLEEFEASYVLTEEDLIEIAEIRRDLIERGELKAFDDDEESSYESSSSSSSGDGSESSGSLDTIDRDRIDRSRRYLMLTRLDEKAYRADRYGEPKGFVDAHRLFDYELKVDTMRSRQSRAYQLLESGEPLLTYPVANASPKHPLAVGRAVEILDTARLARNRDYEFDDYEEDDMQTFDYYFDLELEMDGVRQCETDLALELRRQLDEKARADEERLARKEVRKKKPRGRLGGLLTRKKRTLRPCRRAGGSRKKLRSPLRTTCTTTATSNSTTPSSTPSSTAPATSPSATSLSLPSPTTTTFSPPPPNTVASSKKKKKKKKRRRQQSPCSSTTRKNRKTTTKKKLHLTLLPEAGLLSKEGKAKGKGKQRREQPSHYL